MSGFRRQLMGTFASRRTVRVVEGDLQFNSSESCRYVNLLLPNTGIWRVDYLTIEKTAEVGSPTSGKISIYGSSVDLSQYSGWDTTGLIWWPGNLIYSANNDSNYDIPNYAGLPLGTIVNVPLLKPAGNPPTKISVGGNIDTSDGKYVVIRAELNNNQGAYTVHYKFKATLVE